MAKTNITQEDVLAGLDAVISVYVKEPKFDSQAKVKLSGKEIEDAVYNALVKEFNKFLSDLDDEQRKELKTKIVNNAKIRQAADVAKLAKKKSIKNVSHVNLPTKLKDCALAGKDDRCELYICEGDSACGSILAARDAQYQAALPIRGKILNVMKLDMRKKDCRNKFNNNAEIDSIIKALGTGIGEHCDVDKCRYGKIIFATDSDVDGAAISVLLLGLFYTIFRPVVEAGMVYKCVSPFYEVTYKKGNKEFFEYAVNEKERVEITKRLDKQNVKYHVARAKGLGELNAQVFHDITMNPENRTLVQVTIDDIEKDFAMLNLAIGTEHPDARKEWMIENSDVIEELGLYT